MLPDEQSTQQMIESHPIFSWGGRLREAVHHTLKVGFGNNESAKY